MAFSAGTPNKILDENNEPVIVDNKFTYKDKTEDEIKESVEFLMNDILLSTKADSYIGFIKGKGNFRYSINPSYKSNRPKESPKWWSFTKKCFINDFGAIEVNGIEVDDAVNITRLNIPNSFICAIDKDLLSLEGEHYNWRKKEWIITSKDDAITAFWCDMIAGQPGDAIKGVPGKGVKYFNKIIEDSELISIGGLVLKEYIKFFGEELGVDEFYKNYKSLKILENHEAFLIPEPIKFRKTTEELF